MEFTTGKGNKDNVILIDNGFRYRLDKKSITSTSVRNSYWRRVSDGCSGRLVQHNLYTKNRLIKTVEKILLLNGAYSELLRDKNLLSRHRSCRRIVLLTPMCYSVVPFKHLIYNVIIPWTSLVCMLFMVACLLLRKQLSLNRRKSSSYDWGKHRIWEIGYKHLGYPIRHLVNSSTPQHSQSCSRF